MRDPHVEELLYRVETDGSVNYLNPPPLVHQTSNFDIHLEGGKLRIRMRVHTPDAEKARGIIEPFLLAWETDAFLYRGKLELQFKYEDAKIVDRDPQPAGNAQDLKVSGLVVSGGIVFTPTYIESRNKYPDPPIYLDLSPDTETLLIRYRAYKSGREPLPAMAYFCLTVLQIRMGGKRGARKLVAEKYHIEPDVLNLIGMLSSERGDSTTARKFEVDQKPLTANEESWLDAAIRLLIRQVAICDFGSTPIRVGMGDLPRIQYPD